MSISTYSNTHRHANIHSHAPHIHNHTFTQPQTPTHATAFNCTWCALSRAATRRRSASMRRARSLLSASSCSICRRSRSSVRLRCCTATSSALRRSRAICLRCCSSETCRLRDRVTRVVDERGVRYKTLSEYGILYTMVSVHEISQCCYRVCHALCDQCTELCKAS